MASEAQRRANRKWKIASHENRMKRNAQFHRYYGRYSDYHLQIKRFKFAKSNLEKTLGVRSEDEQQRTRASCG